MRRIFLTFLIIGSVALESSIARAQEEKPDGTVKLSSGSVAVGVGFSWGSGMLTYQGKEYPFSVSGLSVADVGISQAEASGDVYHLKKLADFNGNYTGVSAGATIAGGGGGMAPVLPPLVLVLALQPAPRFSSAPFAAAKAAAR